MGGLDPTPPALRHFVDSAGGVGSSPPKKWWWGISGRAGWWTRTESERQRRGTAEQRQRQGQGPRYTRTERNAVAARSDAMAMGRAGVERAWRWRAVSGRGGKARGPGRRSFEALRWLARLEVAGVEPLGQALGFGRRATYSHVARLAGAGLVVRAFDRGGSVVAITAAGRRAIGADRGDVRAGATARLRAAARAGGVVGGGAADAARARVGQRARAARAAGVAGAGGVGRAAAARIARMSGVVMRGRAGGGRGRALAQVAAAAGARSSPATRTRSPAAGSRAG